MAAGDCDASGDAPRGRDPPGSVGALVGQANLHSRFNYLYEYMYAGPEGTIRSGPRSVSMARDQSAGQEWEVSIGSTVFKLGIQDASGVSISEAMALLGRVPPSIRRAYEIVSEPGHAGVAFYGDLGACGHAGESYINLASNCGAGVAAHEAGHTLEQRVRLNYEPALLDQWGTAGNMDGISVSDYGDTNNWEEFAEFAKYYAYCLSGGSSTIRELRDASPQRFGLFGHALFRAGGGAPPLPMCWCRNPGQGTSNYNGFSCNDGTDGWCSSEQECHRTDWWQQEQPSSACRTVAVPTPTPPPTPTQCYCRTPGQGTSGYNGYNCDDGTEGWCQADQECYLNGWWELGYSYPPNACRYAAPSSCMWRQTGNCDPHGPREPHFDQGCDAQIPDGASGWCDCNGDDRWDLYSEYAYDCSASPGTCNSLCR